MLKKFTGSILVLGLIFLISFSIRLISGPSIQAPRDISKELVAQTPQDNILLGRKININTATAEVFETLPGIGPSLAKRIVAYREKHGAFSKVETLDKVKGVGPATLAKIRPYITRDDTLR